MPTNNKGQSDIVTRQTNESNQRGFYSVERIFHHTSIVMVKDAEPNLTYPP
jgi:hypothetical protein